jgi:hypothetical protein
MREYRRAQPNFAVRTILSTSLTLRERERDRDREREREIEIEIEIERAKQRRDARALGVILVLPADIFRVVHDKGSEHSFVHLDAESAQLVHARGGWGLARVLAGLDFDAESRVK